MQICTNVYRDIKYASSHRYLQRYKKWKDRPPPPAPVRAAAACATDKDAVNVMEELTNEAEAVTKMLDLAVARDIVQILCTSFTLLHIKLCNFYLS